MFAFVGDVVGLYLDNQGRESRLSTATQRKNVIALAGMLGYRLPGASAATADLVFTLAQPAGAAVRIPAGTVLRTREVTNAVRFQLNDVVIDAGAGSAAGTVENSGTRTRLFDVLGLANSATVPTALRRPERWRSRTRLRGCGTRAPASR